MILLWCWRQKLRLQPFTAYSCESGLFLRTTEKSIADESFEESEAISESKSEIKDNYIYVVSQLCEPNTLKYKLAQRTEVDPEDSKRIFIQVCRGVQGKLIAFTVFFVDKLAPEFSVSKLIESRYLLETHFAMKVTSENCPQYS